jgi:hypothetical protein
VGEEAGGVSVMHNCVTCGDYFRLHLSDYGLLLLAGVVAAFIVILVVELINR